MERVVERTEANLPQSVLDTVAALRRLLVAAFGPSRIVSVQPAGSMARGTALRTFLVANGVEH